MAPKLSHVVEAGLREAHAVGAINFSAWGVGDGVDKGGINLRRSEGKSFVPLLHQVDKLLGHLFQLFILVVARALNSVKL